MLNYLKYKGAFKGVFMKKTLKILLFGLLAAIMAVSAFARSGSTDSGKKGLILTKSADSDSYKVAKFVDDGVSVVNGTLDIGAIATEQGKTVGKIRSGAFNGDSSIKKLVVPATVTEIEAGAFAGMKALEEIVLPFVGANATGDASFNQTGSAENKAVEEKRSIGYVFGKTEYAEGKTETLFYAAEKSSVYYLPVSLTKITINPAENYRLPMYAFNGLNDVATVVLGDKVTEIGEYAFANSGVSAVTVADTVESIDAYAFYNCKNLKGLSFGAASALAEIKSHAFYATSIENIVLPAGVTKIGEYAFASEIDSSANPIAAKNASALESITLSANLTEIGEGAFLLCKSLTTVDFSAVTAATVDLGNYGFAYCTALTAATVEGKCNYNANGNCFKDCL